MTIRDIFIKADVKTVYDYFCGAPITVMRDESAFSICKGLQYFAEHGIHVEVNTTSKKGHKLTEKQAKVIANHFVALLMMVYDALGIDGNDEQAEKKLNDYLSQEVKMRKGEDVNDVAIRLMEKMHGLEHFRHRCIECIRETTDHATLHRWLQEVEGAIKQIVGDTPLDYYTSYLPQSDIEKISYLLGTRRLLLDRMFTYSDDEVKRFEQVNDLLEGLSKQMYHRTAELYRTILRSGVDRDFDDDYEVEGTLNTGVEYDPEDGDYDTVQHLADDDYYGSDFSYMLYVLRENDEKDRYCLTNIEDCIVSHSEGNTPDMTDEELDCDWTFLNDGDSWIEWHRHPRLNHICVCHALNSLFDHHNYSLADILRINSYWVEAKIVCQRITDQRGRRYKDIRGE